MPEVIQTTADLKIKHKQQVIQTTKLATTLFNDFVNNPTRVPYWVEYPPIKPTKKGLTQEEWHDDWFIQVQTITWNFALKRVFPIYGTF